MRVADYIWSWLADHGVEQAFLITGGGAMHLNDALARQPRIAHVCHHHEQACTIAAEGYARVAGCPAVVSVTTGPGGINALTGVYGAWTDSIPMLVISGQVKRETCVSTYPWLVGLRQLGDQEVDIITLAKPLTKYAVSLDEPRMVRRCLERAWRLSRSGRPGPCWIDVPIDVQAAIIDPDDLPGDEGLVIAADPTRATAAAERILDQLAQAKRPVILPGTGVRLAGGVECLREVSARLGVPVAGTWTGLDLIPNDHPCYAGRAGTIGDRAGNFAVQSADLVIVLGSRLNLRQVSYNWRSFAHRARIIQVDIDPLELQKPTVRPHEGFVADVGEVLAELARLAVPPTLDPSRHREWLGWCRERVERHPVVQARQRVMKGALINPYHFIDRLYRNFADDEVVVCGNATASVTGFQAATIRAGQRVFANSGCAAMGYDLPAAIGAALARRGGRVVCLAGDGSLMMNIQELQTASCNRLPIKLFVLNNGGYLSMRLTQDGFFKKRIGESASSGISFPGFQQVGAAFGWPTCEISGANFEDGIRAALASDGPMLAEVMLDPDQSFEPKLSSRQLPDGTMVSPVLDDMQPFLERDEVLANRWP